MTETLPDLDITPYLVPTKEIVGLDVADNNVVLERSIVRGFDGTYFIRTIDSEGEIWDAEAPRDEIVAEMNRIDNLREQDARQVPDNALNPGTTTLFHEGGFIEEIEITEAVVAEFNEKLELYKEYAASSISEVTSFEDWLKMDKNAVFGVNISESAKKKACAAFVGAAILASAHNSGDIKDIKQQALKSRPVTEKVINTAPQTTPTLAPRSADSIVRLLPYVKDAPRVEVPEEAPVGLIVQVPVKAPAATKVKAAIETSPAKATSEEAVQIPTVTAPTIPKPKAEVKEAEKADTYKPEIAIVRDTETNELYVTVDGMIHFGQGDPRWRDQSYNAKGVKKYSSKSTVRSSGCGAAAFAAVVTNLTGKVVTPGTMAKFSSSNGFRVPGSGTSPRLFTEGDDNFGVEAHLLTGGSNTVKEAFREGVKDYLKQGGMLIVTTADHGGRDTSPFTGGAHIIVIRGMTEDGRYLVLDSSDGNPDMSRHLKKSSKSWSEERLLEGLTRVTGVKLAEGVKRTDEGFVVVKENPTRDEMIETMHKADDEKIAQVERQTPHLEVSNPNSIMLAPQNVPDVENPGPGNRGQDERLSQSEIDEILPTLSDEDYVIKVMGGQKFYAVINVYSETRKVEIPAARLRLAHYQLVLKAGKSLDEMASMLIKRETEIAMAEMPVAFGETYAPSEGLKARVDNIVAQVNANPEFRDKVYAAAKAKNVDARLLLALYAREGMLLDGTTSIIEGRPIKERHLHKIWVNSIEEDLVVALNGVPGKLDSMGKMAKDVNGIDVTKEMSLEQVAKVMATWNQYRAYRGKEGNMPYVINGFNANKHMMTWAKGDLQGVGGVTDENPGALVFYIELCKVLQNFN